ncbi:MAG TPA: ABC transporter substrate-binding protein [Actinophytocola sp.]|uniref:peptide ABC transporter substrate-binding protein n=1 Tax=Actinophytocola sp. TaxID=1872138 RepID=UPI002DB7A806|nr:ABC transporter substrate-binding protein [Actinophytocola sp.]HEU5469969.1 ABC transporter substrate-binding protein [Actinophytocola sp.]
MRRSRWLARAAGPLTLALVLSGCGTSGDDSGGGNNSDQQAKNDSTEITVFGTDPENPLVPGNTTETGGSKVIDALFTGLVKYDPVSGEPKNAHAENIETAQDGKSITFKLKSGWKFHDGTDVKAKNYVDAWNYTAYSPNGQQGASFFAQVKGFEEVNTADPDGDGPQQAPEPAAKTMSGLEVVDDLTFKVTFTEAHPIFATKVGYTTFMPLPDLFFSDKAGFEAKPIGNGPFKFISRVPKQEIKVERFEEYAGEDKPKIKMVKFAYPESVDAAYAQVKGNQLDFLDTIPPSGLAGNVWKEDLKGRSGNSEILSIQVLAFPLYDPKYGNADFRKAISMAINRDEITKVIFEGNRVPVNGYGVPKLPGWTDGACGEFCKFDPTKAKELFAKSGFQGPLEITSNADGGHKEWIEAACGNIKNTLGLDCTFVPVQTFGEIRRKINAHEMTQVYRAGWLADYPLVENFLNPLYRTGASSNDNLYTNPAVDAKLAEADKATSQEEAFKLYHEAEEMIAKDMPAIPLWNTSAQWGHSTKVKNVRMTPKRELDLSFVEIA